MELEEEERDIIVGELSLHWRGVRYIEEGVCLFVVMLQF